MTEQQRKEYKRVVNEEAFNVFIANGGIVSGQDYAHDYTESRYLLLSAYLEKIISLRELNEAF